ncbi:hypothetical protein MC7420_4608 [Coleofasciculus chthonoplastes PCC 7420]|uniref:Uncharacterized protein n=1 Tax=Coleofasciculus chthonoplastes PCC 7420 TaxID=118168 RepID=B4VNI3_9CYAN|nr:hypothetical protein MC7420_4608 [Coleofasciculus chthonoplastes PCC 7420]
MLEVRRSHLGKRAITSSLTELFYLAIATLTFKFNQFTLA